MAKLTDYELWTAIGGQASGFDAATCWKALKETGKFTSGIKEGLMSKSVEGDKDEIVAAVKEQLEHNRIMQEHGSMEAYQEFLEEQQEVSQVLITSGYSFEGYRITRYSGYISGDDCVTLPRDNFWGNNKVDQNLCGALVKIRQRALKELKEAAYALGCNAVIGVDFDYLVMDPQHAGALSAQVTVYEPYVICVTANGNAVKIEKE